MLLLAEPYINTLGKKRFKEFLLQPFAIDMLAPVFGDKSVNTLFDGWRGKDMVNWHKFTNEDRVTLEFYPEGTYVIKDKKSDKVYQLRITKTINCFINDMKNYDIPLYWSQWIDENFDPKEYLAANGIKDYYVDLLARMGKSQELI